MYLSRYQRSLDFFPIARNKFKTYKAVELDTPRAIEGADSFAITADTILDAERFPLLVEKEESVSAFDTFSLIAV